MRKLIFHKQLMISVVSGAFILFGCYNLWAQDQPLSDPLSIIPPSPTMSALHAPINYPVNGNTGIPEITIPIYTIEAGKIKVPIILRYHPANAKIDGSVNCNVAHGWTLETGGAVSRTIKNKPDESAVMYNLKDGQIFDQFDNYEDQKLLSRMYSWTNESNLDTEHDLFQYSFPNDQGAFFLKRTGSLMDSPFQAIFSPTKPYKLDSYTYTGSPLKILTGFILRSDNELSYHYGGGLNLNQLEFATMPGDGGGKTVSSWMLNKIEEKNGNTVSFRYLPLGALNYSYENRWYRAYDSPISYYEGMGPKWELCRSFVEYYGAKVDSGPEIYSTSIYEQLLPSEIIFPQGKVVFTIVNYLISGVSIYDSSNNLYLKYSFQTTPGGIAGNTLLTSISVTNSNNDEVDKYNISYHPSNLGTKASFDIWGYCNGYDYGSGPLPNAEFKCYEHFNYVRNIQSGNNANRTPSESSILQDMLSSITYKSGGRTTFEFEPNKYIYQADTHLGSEKTGPGVRIKQINHVDADGTTLQSKRYEYGPGRVFLEPNQEYFNMLPYYNIYLNEDITGGYYAYGERVRRFTPKWTPFVDMAGENVHYQWQEETLLKNNLPDGTTRLTFSTVNNVSFSQVCANYFEVKMPMYFDSKYISVLSNTWEQPQLIKKEMYDASGTLRQKITYTYAYTGHSSKLLNLGLYKFTNYISDAFVDMSVLRDYTSIADWKRSPDFPYLTKPTTPPLLYYYYTHEIDRESLVSQTTESYTADKTIIETIEYEYGSHYPKEVRQRMSNGSYHVRKIKYPYDYTISQDASAYNMAAANYLSPIIEEETILREGNTEYPLDHRKVTYTQLSGSPGLYRPSELFYATNGAALQSKTSYTGYDTRGNLTEIRDANGVPTTYIWGYNGLYPVARAVNMNYQTFKNLAGISSNLVNGITGDYNSIRQSSPNALIDFYEYNPMLGLKKQIDPSGKVLQYDYTLSGKLKSMTNDSGYLMQQYFYSPDNKQQ